MSTSWSLSAAPNNDKSLLVKAIAQYPILESLVSHLRPDHLIDLTLLSQATRTQIRMHEADARISLLKKTLCPGFGLSLRHELHCPCRTKKWHTMMGCAGEGFNANSQPCDRCNVNTCDECRFHILYQVFVESPGLDNRRWWAGFVGTLPTPVSIYPPKGSTSAQWRGSVEAMQPHHDQGRVHAELTAPELADPEPIDHLLDWNLGHGYINPSGRTNGPYAGHDVVSPFNYIARDRIRLLCKPCHDEQSINTTTKICSCTLRGRFLDRWVCLRCYAREAENDKAQDADRTLDEDGISVSRRCPCGTSFGRDDPHAKICNWCNGIVLNKQPKEGGSGAGGTATEDGEEMGLDSDDEADAADGPGEVEMMHRRDGSLTIVVDGKRIHKEKVSRAIVEQWAVHHGAELGCTCCHCPGRGMPPHELDGVGEGSRGAEQEHDGEEHWEDGVEHEGNMGDDLGELEGSLDRDIQFGPVCGDAGNDYEDTLRPDSGWG